MRVSVDDRRCIVSGTCADICPEVFQVGGDGLLHVVQEEPAEAVHQQVAEAAELCPTGAIRVDP